MINLDLTSRLEAATEGSRELSDEVLKAAGWKFTDSSDPRNHVWISPDGEAYDWWDDPHARSIPMRHRPCPTTSIDAAVGAVVPDGCRWEIQQDHTAAFASVDGQSTGRCRTPALALSAAALKAREA